MKTILILALVLFTSSLYAGGGGSVGGGIDAGGNDSRVAPGFNTRVLGSNPDKISISHQLILGISAKNGTFVDMYDLQYTNAGKKMGIMMKDGKVHLPISEYSKWKRIELENGKNILNPSIQFNHRMNFRVRTMGSMSSGG